MTSISDRAWQGIYLELTEERPAISGDPIAALATAIIGRLESHHLLAGTERPPGVDLVASIADMMQHQDAIHGMAKTADDLDRYKAIFADDPPDLIIETGTWQGVSAAWFAETAKATVITIDVQPAVHASLTRLPVWESVTMVYGDSTDPDIVRPVRDLAGRYDSVMVVLDSDHQPAHVYKELVAYGELVTPGQYLVVEDTLCRWAPWMGYDDGPLSGLEEWMTRYGTDLGFAVDEKIEGMRERSQHPGGWLRRTPRG